MFDKYIDNYKEDIISTLSELIKFKSVYTEQKENSLHPFGEECTKVLEKTLEIADSMGFKTKNIDNYCGYIEFGSGKGLVGIIGHLDVVPANENDGWSTPPFEASIRDGKIFGRGTNDDKGPVVAALYAMKTVLDNAKVNKRVRLILGLNEESGWKCIEHYKKVEEIPSISFSPDANFPGIYAEKGIISVELKHPYFFKNAQILNIDCNNNALNVVPKYCSITLKTNTEELFNKIIHSPHNSNIDLQVLENNVIKIISTGKSAHAARPKLGNNAITNLINFLLEINILESNDFNYLNRLNNFGLFTIESPEFFSLEDLNNLDFSQLSAIEDESGILTSNIAYLGYENNKLIIKINLRVPVNTSLDFIEDKYNSLKNVFNELEVNILSKQEPLYVKKDSYLVKTLVDIFNKKTGLNCEPIAIGGGTYARAFENSISYGITFPGDLDMCHQVDEFVDIDKLILSSKIYAEAIYKLAQ